MKKPEKRSRLLPYLRRLHGYAQSLTRDPDQAEELVQDASLKALAAKSVPEAEPVYRVWLFRILRNTFIDGFRYRQLRERTEIRDEEIDDIAMEYHVSDDRLIDRMTVRSALAKLKPNHAEILTMIDVSGLSYREAADVLDVPVGTVMSRVSRARAMLLSILESGDAEVVDLAEQRKVRGGSTSR